MPAKRRGTVHFSIESVCQSSSIKVYLITLGIRPEEVNPKEKPGAFEER
jgi:hypothetical protein